jgi:hypothetical protein
LVLTIRAGLFLIRSKKAAAFLKKAAQKTFFKSETEVSNGSGPESKVFLPHRRPDSFCSQKEVLPGPDSSISDPAIGCGHLTWGHRLTHNGLEIGVNLPQGS